MKPQSYTQRDQLQLTLFNADNMLITVNYIYCFVQA